MKNYVVYQNMGTSCICYKNRERLLTEEIRYKVINHIKENCKDKLIFLQAINGHLDHLHCLISLGREQNIAKVAQLIKGESAFWINKNSLTPTKFIWQDDYYAISVSESNVDIVVNYIRIKKFIMLKNLLPMKCGYFKA